MNNVDKNLDNTNPGTRVPIVDLAWRLKRDGDTPYFLSADGREKRVINDMTAVIYSLCDNRNTVTQIVQKLCEMYPDAGGEIEKDVPVILQELENYNIIRLRDEKPDLEIPEATAPHEHRKLCIGMATYDDYDGVYFSIQAIRFYHPEILDQVEFIVVDNHPGGDCSKALKQLEGAIGNYRYLPNDHITGTAVRDYVFQQANADYVICMDSHVLIQAGAIQKLVDYLDQRPGCKDLLQGPLLYDQMTTISTHFKPEWRAGMYGTWAKDDRGDDSDGEAFDIPMQGLGLFACRKDAWPGFNPRFSGFGGEEGYIHEKFRQAGGRSLCLPFLRWLHRFTRPMGTRYEVRWADRIRNYMIGHHELGLELQPIKDHFAEYVGEKATNPMFEQIEAELANPFHYFDAIYCINLKAGLSRWRQMELRFEELGIAHRVRRFEAIETPENQHIGCTLSHREIVRVAAQQNLASVLVFEDDALILDDLLDHLRCSLVELAQTDWQLFYLGGCLRDQVDRTIAGLNHLHRATTVTCTHAIAYHRRSYQKILSEIPDSTESIIPWIKKEQAIDQYLMNHIDQGYLAFPTLCAQMQTMGWEQPELKERYT